MDHNRGQIFLCLTKRVSSSDCVLTDKELGFNVFDLSQALRCSAGFRYLNDIVCDASAAADH